MIAPAPRFGARVALGALGAFLASGGIGVAPIAAQPVVEDVVSELVAAEWGLDADAIVLEWGRARPEASDDAAVELRGSGAGGHWVVRVTTPGGSSSAFRVRAGHTSRRSFAASRIPRGAEVVSEQIVVRETTVWGPPEPVERDLEPGWVAQRAIRKDEALSPPAVRPPHAVVSGAVVELLWKSPRISIRMRGTAAGNASLGESVRVRTDAGKRMVGVVVAIGLVDVTPATTHATGGGGR